jgi:hypothetical protein
MSARNAEREGWQQVDSSRGSTLDSGADEEKGLALMHPHVRAGKAQWRLHDLKS